MDSLIIEVICTDVDKCEHIWEAVSKILEDDPQVENLCQMQDVTDETNKHRRVINALLEEGRTRVPLDMDRKSDEYVQRVQLHNIALTELSNALYEVGYRQR